MHPIYFIRDIVRLCLMLRLRAMLWRGPIAGQTLLVTALWHPLSQ